MSDTENKTENTTETKTVDTTPYMKKPGQEESKTASSKTEMLIPAILILVSAIVIGATFYNKDSKAPVAQIEAPVNTTVSTTASETETTPAADATSQQLTAAKQATDEEKPAQTEALETSEKSTVAENEETATPVIQETVLVSEEKIVAVNTQPAPAAAHKVTMRPPAAAYQRKPYSREQVQAKQHMQMMQQRRQAYEREMQDRRARYEAAMKAQQAKRAKIAEAKKAVFQRVQKDRLATEQKIQAIHKQIAKLHDEIHQIMRESRRNSAPVKMHSM